MSRHSSRRVAWIVGLSLVVTGVVSGPVVAGDGELTPVDVPTHPASVAQLSDDGTRAAYEVEAYPAREVRVRDLTTGADQLISAKADGSPGAGFSHSPRFSKNGRFVIFQSDAQLVSTDTDSVNDTYLKDLETGATTRVSEDASGQKESSEHFATGEAAVADDGTVALSIAKEDCEWLQDPWGEGYQRCTREVTLFVKEPVSGDLRSLLSHPSLSDLDLSADGAWVLVRTNEDLVPEDTDANADFYLLPVGGGTAELVSPLAGPQGRPVLSADGSRIAYSGWLHGTGSALVFDRATGTTLLASSTDEGVPGNDYSHGVRLSSDGRYAAFASTATNLDPMDTDSINDVYLKDLETGTISLISQTQAGVKGDDNSFPLSLTPGGQRVFFWSWATNFGSSGPGPVPWSYYAKDVVTEVPDTQGPEVVVQFPPVPASGWYTEFPTGTVQVTDPSGVAEVSCQPGGARLSDVTELGTSTVTATVTVEQDGRPQVDCYAVDSLGNWGGEEVDQILQIDTTPPLVQVVFPDPPASGWYTSTPVTGYVNVADSSHVTSITCLGALTSDVPALPLQNATATLTVDAEGVHAVTCTATNGAGLSGASGDSTSTATVKIDPDADPWVAIDGAVATATAGAFSDNTDPITSGSVVNANGLAVTITDEADPDGVSVQVAAGAGTDGSGKVTLSVCGMTLKVAAGSQIIATCGSVIVHTISGPAAEVVLDAGAIVVSIPAGSSAEVSDTDQGARVENVQGGVVTSSVNGTTSTIAPGSGVTELSLVTWVITGFFQPVDNLPTLNIGKAGRAIPLKWHLTDSDANPITDLDTANVTVKPLDCVSGAVTDALETTMSVGSGLLNLGDGNYQLNWKTSTAWAGTCKVMTLDLGDGVTKLAHFKFTK